MVGDVIMHKVLGRINEKEELLTEFLRRSLKNAVPGTSLGEEEEGSSY